MTLFEDKGNFPESWLFKAKEFHESATVVWIHNAIPDINGDLIGSKAYHPMYRPAQLLMGLALETGLKALAIKKGKVKISGSKLPGALKTHSIEKISQLANFVINDENELKLVRHLSEAIDWVSKYPVPTEDNYMKISRYNAQDVLFRNDGDYNTYELIFKRIIQEYSK